MRSDGMLGMDSDVWSDDRWAELDGVKTIATIAQVLRQWDRLRSAPLCPCCGKQTRFIDKDQFGTVHCECEAHGAYTLQVAA